MEASVYYKRTKDAFLTKQNINGKWFGRGMS